MNIKQLAASTFVLAFAVSVHAKDTPQTAKETLEKILTCENDAPPEEVVSLIKMLGGVAIMQANDLSDAEYTIPNPVDIFGRPVTKISIHHGKNADGGFYEYGSLFTGESIGTVAKFAGIIPDAAGNYRKEIGSHDLILRKEAGATYVTCANDVRTIVKTINRTARNVGNEFGKATRGK